MLDTPQQPETIFTYGAPPLKFGSGASEEIGHDLAVTGVRRILLITDPGIAATGIPARIAERMEEHHLDVGIFTEVHIEPTDASLQAAVDHARETGPWDAYVAVGGGSSIDTAKAVNLLTTNPGDLEEYLNPPVGQGRAPTTPLLPLVAVPTTTGTGSESTTICVLDVLALRVKTGISHVRLRPSLAVVDPDLTFTQPAEVTAAAGLDILCHALESYTARPYTAYERKRPEERVPYCGANPIADMWSLRALELLAGSFRRAVADGQDAQARNDMAMAATFAGLGFGNAGVHIPHANAYPIAGQVRRFRPKGYPGEGPLVPHGMAVALTAPEAFRFTFEASPDRHLAVAAILQSGAGEPATPAEHQPGAPADRLPGAPAERLPAALLRLMRDVGMPNGIGAIGFEEADVPALVEGALKQQRLLAISPRPVSEDDLAGIFTRSLELW